MPSRPFFTRTGTAVALALTVALLGTACDKDDDEGGGSGKPTTTIAADHSVTITAEDSPSLDFAPEELETPAGAIEIVLENDGALPHTLVIGGKGGFKLKVAKKGSVDRATVELSPGTYELYCDIPGHRVSGDKMETALTVT